MMAGEQMTIQRIELHGERYVIIPEREFLELQRQVSGPQPAGASQADAKKFRDVTPLKLDGIPASEMLIRDRR